MIVSMKYVEGSVRLDYDIDTQKCYNYNDAISIVAGLMFLAKKEKEAHIKSLMDNTIVEQRYEVTDVVDKFMPVYEEAVGIDNGALVYTYSPDKGRDRFYICIIDDNELYVNAHFFRYKNGRDRTYANKRDAINFCKRNNICLYSEYVYVSMEDAIDGYVRIKNDIN